MNEEELKTRNESMFPSTLFTRALKSDDRELLEQWLHLNAHSW